MDAPTLPLTLAYLLHMLATVIWVGGLAALVILVIPIGKRTLGDQGYTAFLERFQHRMDIGVWLSLVILIGTGMFQMSAHPSYEGFLSISSRWSAAILIKHLMIFGMIATSAYLTWEVLPRMKRLALLQAKGQSFSEEQARLMGLNLRLLYLNLLLAVIILALTALARVS
jgi:uncharacterized membrane protein